MPSFERKDGSVVARDLQLNARSELRFTNALVTETGIPALDGAAKDPAYLTLVLEPETTRRVPAKGKATAFAVRRGHDGLLEVPNLAIALAEAAAESSIPRVVAGLYCERMDLVVGKG